MLGFGTPALVELRLAWVLPARFPLHACNLMSGHLQASSQRAVQQGDTPNPAWAATAARSPLSCLRSPYPYTQPDTVSAGKLVRWAGLQWGAGAAECQPPTHLQRGRAAADGDRCGQRPIGPFPCSLKGGHPLLTGSVWPVCTSPTSLHL